MQVWLALHVPPQQSALTLQVWPETTQHLPKLHVPIAQSEGTLHSPPSGIPTQIEFEHMPEQQSAAA